LLAHQRGLTATEHQHSTHTPVGIGQPSKHRFLTVAAPCPTYSSNGAATVRERCLGKHAPRNVKLLLPPAEPGELPFGLGPSVVLFCRELAAR
jgi:hypothetical protein